MPTENDGVMIILSSPSGAGKKTTLVNLLSKEKILKFQFHTQPDNRDKRVWIKKITTLYLKKVFKD